MPMTLRAMFLALFTTLAVAAPAAAEPDVSDLVPAKPITITKPPTGKIDNLFAVAPVPGGFLVTWARSTGSVPPFTLIAQKYTSTGVATGKSAIIDGPGTVGDVVVARVMKSGQIGLFWMRGGHVWAAKLDPATMVVSSKTDLGKSDDHIHDATVLANGNIAVITAQIDVSNPSAMRYKNSIKVVDASFKTVKPWASIHGSGFPLDGWAYLDQSIVAHAAGGLALYRDHVTNTIMGRNFSTSGVQAASTVRINTTTMSKPYVSDLPYFRVEAARLTSGKLAVCWVSLEQTGLKRYEVRCRMTSSSGVPTGADFLVHSSVDGGQTSPDVIALPGDRFAVTWVHADVIYPNHVRHRVFDAAGKPVNVQRTGHSFTATDLTLPPLDTQAVALADGSIAVVMNQSAFVPGLRAFGIAKPAN